MGNDTQIVWAEPPRTNKKWGPILEELKRNPGRWALNAQNDSHGQASFFKKRGLEVPSKTAGIGYKKGNSDLYVRWPETSKTR